MYPTTHVNKWPAALMVTGDNTEVEDFADEPGKDQVFPAVAPPSYAKLGPQDLRQPHEILAALREKEKKDDIWAFDRDRAKAALAREQLLVCKFRQQAKQAEKSAADSKLLASARLVEIEHAADVRKSRGEADIRATKMRIEEAHRMDEATQIECRQRIAEAQALLENEKRSTAEVEQLFEKERTKSEATWQRVANLEAESQERLAARDLEVQAADQEAQRRIAQARDVADARIREVEERFAAELRRMQERLAITQEQCTERIRLESERKAQSEQEAVDRRTSATSRLETEKQCMKQVCATTLEDCRSHLERVLHREDETATYVGKKVHMYSELFDLASARSLEAHRKELHSTMSLEQTVHILGKHVATRQQYNTALDNKISTSLHGCLHNTAGEPSPRSLPIPKNFRRDSFSDEWA
eukprot:gnl/TRDRNA2_/TRDRNA2_36604_c0_seq1.p1 gnl/TRDRNA2_/TRDRNA2_36604_c0~~gnl/TRDRNA2_/TRDRNA2_36604_c0_seq1.p1  ORF type:complete len:417 (-),score=101.18 gnl/TRDRNA2_/TRDRNA2_36604_c0_seq1:167-1417(-)